MAKPRVYLSDVKHCSIQSLPRGILSSWYDSYVISTDELLSQTYEIMRG